MCKKESGSGDRRENDGLEHGKFRRDGEMGDRRREGGDVKVLGKFEGNGDREKKNCRGSGRGE